MYLWKLWKGMAKHERDYIQAGATIVVAVWFLFCGFIGMIQGAQAGRYEFTKNNCTYQSIMARLNIPYVLGCELTRPRWKPKGETK